MRRRQFIAGLGGAAAWPLAARAQQTALAQQGAVPMVGYLSPGARNDSFATNYIPLIRSGLAERGYVEGRNVVIEYRFAEGQYERLPALATELVRLKAMVLIVITSTVALPAAVAAGPTTPIVFISGIDPIEVGVVPRLNRPGGNITGIVTSQSNMASKQLGLLHELLHKGAKTAALVNPANPGAVVWAKDAASAAGVLGIEFMIVNAVSAPEIEAAFVDLVQAYAGALLVVPDPFFRGRLDQIVALAARYRIPAIYPSTDYAAAGGLMSYTSNPDDLYRTVGIYVARILRGEKPADLPVQQPTNFEFVINLKTAAALGIEVPPMMSARADKVIE
jgi:putative ABC transport system substrate-binding protein